MLSVSVAVSLFERFSFSVNLSSTAWLDGYFVVLSVNEFASLFATFSGVYHIVSCFPASNVAISELAG